VFDPTYTGLGDWPPELDRDAWVELACDVINEIGARAYLRRMLAALDGTLADEGSSGATALRDVLADHVFGRQVQAITPLPGVPGALLVFDDRHSLPVVRPPWIRGPAPDFDRCRGQYLVGLAVKDDGLHPAWFELSFHADPGRAGYWYEAEGLTVHTLQRSGQAVFCPYDHGAPLAPPDDAAEVLQQLHAAVVGKRVAHQVRLPSGPAALVFDDWHVLPIAPRQTQPLNLEAVVGRFLVWADVVEEYDSPANDTGADLDQPGDSYVELTFADDAAWADRLRRAAGAANGADRALTEVLETAQAADGVSVIEATLESAGALFVAAEDDTQAAGDWDDDDGPA
jgi:hypothetical protein